MYIKVRAKTYAKEEKIEVLGTDTLRISVKERPENGEANRRILELIRAYIGPKARAIRIENGAHSPHKLIRIDLGE